MIPICSVIEHNSESQQSWNILSVFFFKYFYFTKINKEKCVLHAHNHKEGLCKWMSGWMRKKGRFQAFLNVFCVVCIVSITIYVPSWLHTFLSWCCLNCTNGNEPSRSALDTNRRRRKRLKRRPISLQGVNLSFTDLFFFWLQFQNSAQHVEKNCK